jgi:hypothetical protein
MKKLQEMILVKDATSSEEVALMQVLKSQEPFTPYNEVKNLQDSLIREFSNLENIGLTISNSEWGNFVVAYRIL